jgi:hypothetical protein
MVLDMANVIEIDPDVLDPLDEDRPSKSVLIPDSNDLEDRQDPGEDMRGYCFPDEDA